MTEHSKFYYSCQMHTQVQLENPGRCPICGMTLDPVTHGTGMPIKRMSDYFKKKLILGALFFAPVLFVEVFFTSLSILMPGFALRCIEVFFSGLVIFVAGYPRLKMGLGEKAHFGCNFMTLPAVAVLIAYGFSLARLAWVYFAVPEIVPDFLAGFYFEPSSLIMLLLLLGQYVLALAQERTMREIERLMDHFPQVAHLMLGRGEERKIAFDDVKRGDILKVKPNEKVPADGVIIEGQSWVGETMLTGEALPIYKRPNDKVFAGSLNGNGSFLMTAEKVGDEALLSKIIDTLEVALKSKPPIQEKIDRFIAFYVPGLLLLSLLVGFGWFFAGAAPPIAVGYTVSMLLVAPSSAFALGIPMSILIGLSLAARNGMLIRDASALELMEKVDTLVVDKAGVLTEGRPLLTKIFALYPFSEVEVLRWGASVESQSEHPLAQAVVTGAKLKQVNLLKSSHFQPLEGKGVVARIDGSRVIVGNRKILEDLGVDPSSLLNEAEKWQKEGLTVSFVAIEDRPVGLIAVADPLRYTAQRIVQQLHREKLSLVLATGDSQEAAEAVGKRLGMDEVFGDVLTQDKMALVQKLQRNGKEVAMAGDGRIDGPALAQADVGIALSPHDDPTLFNASITLLKGDLKGVVRARHLSEIVMRNIRQGLIFVSVYSAIAIPLAAGILTPFFGWKISPLEGCLVGIFAAAVVLLSGLRIRDSILYQD